MSVQASTWVIKHSSQKGANLLVLLMIANYAHADGTNAFPSVETLAKDCRMSKRQVLRILAALEASGELLIDHSAGRNPNRYALAMGRNSDKMSSFNGDKMSRLNSDKMSPLTVTFSTPNGDISDTSTVTFSSSPPTPPYKELEPKEEPKEQKREGEPTPARAAHANVTPIARPKRNGFFNDEQAQKIAEYLDAIREIQCVNVLDDERAWEDHAIKCITNNLSPAEFAKAAGKVFEKCRESPTLVMTAGWVYKVAVQERAKQNGLPSQYREKKFI